MYWRLLFLYYNTIFEFGNSQIIIFNSFHFTTNFFYSLRGFSLSLPRVFALSRGPLPHCATTSSRCARVSPGLRGRSSDETQPSTCARCGLSSSETLVCPTRFGLSYGETLVRPLWPLSPSPFRCGHNHAHWRALPRRSLPRPSLPASTVTRTCKPSLSSYSSHVPTANPSSSKAAGVGEEKREEARQNRNPQTLEYRRGHTLPALPLSEPCAY